MMVMHINRQGLAIIKDSESLQLEAYPDPGSDLFKACQAAKVNPYNGGYKALPAWATLSGAPWTNGWGHTGKDVYPGQKIDAAKADDLLEADLAFTETNVEALLPVEFTRNQFSACVSLAYNIGIVPFAKSTLLRKFDDGDLAGVAEEFKRWNKSKGVVLNGLVTRRAREAELFLTPGDGDDV
jgi:lysozyme